MNKKLPKTKHMTLYLTPVMMKRLHEVSDKYKWPKSRIIDLALRMSLKKIEEILNQ